MGWDGVGCGECCVWEVELHCVISPVPMIAGNTVVVAHAAANKKLEACLTQTHFGACRSCWSEGSPGPLGSPGSFAHPAVQPHRRHGVQGCVLQAFEAQRQLGQVSSRLQRVQPPRVVAGIGLRCSAAYVQGSPHLGADQPQQQGRSLYQLPCYPRFRAA